MKKIGLNKDYITQLTRNLAKIERQHLISLNEIKSRMNTMEKSLKNNFKADSETLKLEEILQIKMAYMMLYIAYKEKYPETNADEDRLFEKQEIIELAHNIEQQSKKEYVKQTDAANKLCVSKVSAHNALERLCLKGFILKNQESFKLQVILLHYDIHKIICL